jgi:hypothetical protein
MLGLADASTALSNLIAQIVGPTGKASWTTPRLWSTRLPTVGADSRARYQVVSRLFRTFGLAERRPALAYAVMAPLIC